MAKVVYKSYNQNDSLLFPHCIGDFIPENDPVRVLDAIVEHLDISAIEATYKGGGASSFAPRMLLKVILYAYLQNIHSGRKMEALLKRDVNFMWLSGMQRPDFQRRKKNSTKTCVASRGRSELHKVLQRRKKKSTKACVASFSKNADISRC